VTPAVLSSCLLLAGPTAVGKSELALLLAEKLNGELVSVDSMQVYRGMDIGTAKPSLAERARISHHLIDILDITEAFDAARFIRLATASIQEIQSRGKTAILCGGTGFYFAALLGGLGTAPPANEVLRGELIATPLADLLSELSRTDPATFAAIDRQNPRRVVRAIEVIRLTGKPFSQQRSAWASSSSLAQKYPPLFFLSRPPAELHRRIEARVDRMFQQGLVEETRQLLPLGLDQNRTAAQALGYRQVIEHVRGDRGLLETIELVKLRTRQFAKRQITWFKKQPGCKPVDLLPDESLPLIAARLTSEWQA
jgi:tRNA dimethylallyltransferase